MCIIIYVIIYTFFHFVVPPIVDISNIVPRVRRRQNESVVIECPAQGIPDPDVSFLKVCHI